MRYTTLTAIVMAAFALAAGVAEAQTWEADFTVDIPSAVELERQVAMAITGARWSDAASMLREAADMRPDDDPIARSNLAQAGALYGTIGDFDHARSAFQALVDRAARYGEVETEAHALIDAAYVAGALGDWSSAAQLHERARRLARSSHLTAEAATTLTNRLSQSPTLVAGVDR